MRGHSPEGYIRQVDNLLYEKTTPTQSNYSLLGPNYEILTTSNEGLDTYDVTDHNQWKTNTPQAKPANPTPVRDEASKKGDDFYDAEEHTYSVVSAKCKNKAQTDGGGRVGGATSM